MTISNAYLIKGYLLGLNAPTAITHAVDAVIESLEAAEIPFITGTMAHEIEIPNPHVDDAVAARPEPCGTQASAATPERKRRQWSPEARAAASERMKKARAAKPAQRQEAPAPREIDPREALAPHPTPGSGASKTGESLGPTNKSSSW